MKVVGFYTKKARFNKPAKVKEIQIDVDRLASTVALTLILIDGSTTVACAGDISSSLQPIIDILKDLAEPVAYGFMVKGFMRIMAGDENEGFKTIKYAIGGFVGIQWIPFIFRTIKTIKF